MKRDEIKSSGTLIREEWDFSHIPAAELKACFLYEYARESQTILALAKGMEGYEYTDSSDYSEPNFFALTGRNHDCAILLAHVGPDLNLAAIPWQALDKMKIAPWQRPDEGKRAFLARVMRKKCFREVPFVEAEVWEQLRENQPDLVKDASYEIVSVRIDWTKPFKEIKEQAIAWLQANPRSKKQKAKRGRHAKEEAAYRDALRRLGALRLWARYPLKEAMQITEDYGVNLYSTYIDSVGRPAHQTAWENGVKQLPKLLRKTFRLSKTEMPVSWDLREKRREKK
jgi:hypothetical protein